MGTSSQDDINVGVIVRAEGENVARQVASDVGALRAQLKQLYDLQNTDIRSANARRLAADQESAARRRATAAAREAAQQAKATQEAIDAQSAAFDGLGKKIAIAAIAFKTFQGFKAFIVEGVQFNQTIETANLGIASLIVAQTEMRDSQGRLVKGVDALGTAEALAADQVQKLRIAGLQTTATTEELIVAFQQAVGVGLRWGLTLDQIRTITIRMAQAAGTLGLPMNQLNEEIRDLLGGNINPRNTRIATALGITNEQVKQAQKAGTLFEFVTKRLEAFGVAGEATAKTLSGILSNLKDAMQNLAGIATAPLTATLKETGQSILDNVFDINQGRINARFQGIVDEAANVFNQLGGIIADAINAGVEGAAEFSRFLDLNRVQVAEILAQIRLVVAEIGGLARDVFALVLPFGQVAVEAGLFKTALAGAGLAVAEIRTALQGVFAVLALFNGIILVLLVEPMVGFLKIAAHAAGVFNEDLGQSIQHVADIGQNFINTYRNGFHQYLDDIGNAGTATDQFLERLSRTDAAAIKAAKAQGVLSEAIQKATDAETESLTAIDVATEKHLLTQAQAATFTTAAKLDSLAKQIAAEKAYYTALDVSDARERRRTLNIIKDLEKRSAATARGITLKSTAEAPKEKDSASAREQGENLKIKEALSEREKELKTSLDRNEISYAFYYNSLAIARADAIRAQIKVQQQLLDADRASKDPNAGKQAKILDQISVLKSQEVQVWKDSAEQERIAEEKLASDVTAIHVQLLRDQGKISEARALEIGDKYKNLIARLKAEGDTAGADLVARLFNIDNAKAKLEELERRGKEATDALAVQLSAIDTEVSAHAITERQARDKIVDAYKRARAELEAMLPAMREQAALTTDPAAARAVDELAIKIQQMSVTIAQTSDEFLKLKTSVKDTLQDSLASFLDNAGAGAKSLKEVWIDTAASIVSSLRRIATQMLANLIIQKLIEVTGFGFSGGGSVSSPTRVLSGDVGGGVHVATGGHIRGAGGPTSDSIPAWLSNGEFVVRARAVRAVGLDLLHEINAQGGASPIGRRRARGFADGGLVAQPSNDPAISGRLELGFEEGLVLRHLETSAGTRVQLKFIENNAAKIRRALGVR